MIRLLCIAGAIALTACGAPIPDDVETYCPDCYERIQQGQAFAPPAAPAPAQSEGGAGR